MGIFDWFKKPKEEKKEHKVVLVPKRKAGVTQTEMTALPIELSRPRPYRVASRLVRLYMQKPTTEINRSIADQKKKLKFFGFTDVPNTLSEAEALAARIEKSQEK